MSPRPIPEGSISRITQLLQGYYIRRQVSPWDAEDLGQEVLLKILRMGHKVEDVEQPYLYTVARTVLIDKYRTETRHKQTAHIALEDDIAVEDETTCPDYQLNEIRLHQRLEISLNSLTEAQRKTFINCKVLGLPMQQVANNRSVSVSAEEKLMSKAKQSLLVGIAS